MYAIATRPYVGVVPSSSGKIKKLEFNIHSLTNQSLSYIRTLQMNFFNYFLDKEATLSFRILL